VIGRLDHVHRRRLIAGKAEIGKLNAETAGTHSLSAPALAGFGRRIPAPYVFRPEFVGVPTVVAKQGAGSCRSCKQCELGQACVLPFGLGWRAEL